ncbi:GNAT family N-acetyltransferase [Photobacterium sp.]|uniref:GNAT family N-acetyltransferase n=1 Tax=Photobacterium sp. TaxID=660 RepID=UPI00299F406A|nr:GNAT family N-acetyltransferase [Photobacterium sp.]MDX1302966.1 GNAT family N-acetyltransferase [Photobacterium sp.]
MIEVSDKISADDLIMIKSHLSEYNEKFMTPDFRDLGVYARAENGELLAGLIGKTAWGYFEINFLWVSDKMRGCGVGSQLLQAAENEGIRRGCKYALVDTFSFQAKGFYVKHGYSIFGEIDDYHDGHTRYYLRKDIQ